MSPAAPATPVRSRSHLLTLLTEACELEHGLLCSYLYAAFSLKQELSEGGMTWRQQQKVRRWAAQIYAVAAEEMLHLAQAWNMLAAIGGTPYYSRPNFPQPATYYDLNLPLALTPFSEHTLKRFIMYELPSHESPEKMAAKLGIPADRAPTSSNLTVGELYGLILSGFETIPAAELIVGDPARQVDESVIDFPDIIRVTGPASARAAVEMITGQGEGTSAGDRNCHFGMFLGVLEDYQAELVADGAGFAPVRHVADNPITWLRGYAGGQGSSLIADSYTRDVADYFNNIYGLMLRMLQFVFSNSTEISDVLKRFAKSAIVVMPTVLKPLGEALAVLPMAAGHPQCAGAPFGFGRHVSLPVEPAVADRLVRERLAELLAEGEALGRDPRAPVYLKNAVRNLRQYTT